MKQHLNSFTVMTLSFQTDRSGQTVQTQIRLLLEEQSDQGLHCLLFHHKTFWCPKIKELYRSFVNPIFVLYLPHLGRTFLMVHGMFHEGVRTCGQTQTSHHWNVTNEPRCEKTSLRGFRPGPTQNRLYSHRGWIHP